MSVHLNFHPERCIGCRVCQTACLDAHDLPVSAALLLLEESEQGEGGALKVRYRLHHCLQCEHPACLESCSKNAIYHQPGGVVSINPSRCTGCGACISACPTHSIHLFEGMAFKCDLCRSMGEPPRCVRACLAYGALELSE